MIEQLLSGFTSSAQGKSAVEVLTKRGLPADQIQKILGEAVPAAQSALSKKAAATGSKEPELGLFDVMGGHPGQAFLIGAMTSILQGEGFTEAAKDGAISVVGSHVSEVIASRVGLDRQIAGWVGAAISPFLVSYAYEKLSGEPSVQKKHGKPLSQGEVVKILTEKRAAETKKALSDPSSPAAQKILAEQRGKIAAKAEHQAIQQAVAAGKPVPGTKAAPAPAKAAPVATKAAPVATKVTAPAKPTAKK